MKEQQKEQRSIDIYVSTILCLSACIMVTMEAIISNWPPYLYYIIWAQMFVIIYTLLDARIPMRIQSFIYSTFTFSTVFLSGLYVENYLLEMVLLCGTLILALFYHKSYLIIYQEALSLIGIFAHIFIFHVIDFTENTKMIEFGIALFLLVGIGCALIVGIERDKNVKQHLKEEAFRAECAEKSKSDFLANMSHEIRTPMNAIIGMCELILREKDLSLETRDYALQIQNSGRSLLSIINDILDFSKIESGKLELVEEEFNLASTLNDVINMTMTRMGDKGLEFIVRVDPNIPCGLIGDEIRIRQILINLLTNAVKYTEEGVITFKVTKTVRKYGINLNFSVKDSGIGISKDDLEKLFNSFQQINTKKNRSMEGTGLGLVITKRLLANMGGFINVSSEYGTGSEFQVVIPLRVSNEKPFLTIKEAKKINAVTFIDMEKYKNDSVKKEYRQFLTEIGSSLQVRNFSCRNMEDLKLRIEQGNCTHCFVSREEYIRYKKYFDSIAEKVMIVVVQNRMDAIKLPANIRSIYKPIYEVPIAGVFNHANPIVDMQSMKNQGSSFVAPNARVLIVDDNAVNLKVAVGLMQPYQMQIMTVDNGRDAIRILENQETDLVFMDHMMPELDGVETTKLIREKDNEYFKKIPIVALTANAVGGAREMFLKNGFDGFLSKPIELSALDRVLKQHLPKEFIIKNMESSKISSNISKEILSEVSKDIDVELGLGYTGNDWTTYIEVLKLFIEKASGKIRQLNEQFVNQDWDNYIIEVHGLKSSSLSIGAKLLSEEAKSLEMNGKAGDFDYILDNHHDMIEIYEKVIKQAEKIIREKVV